MKKLHIIIILLSCISTVSFSQQKTEFGITFESSWFIPHPTRFYDTTNDFAVKNGFGTGVGLYASRNLFWRVSTDIGIAYRYKQMQQHYAVNTGFDDPDTGRPTYIKGWDQLPMHYVIVPVHLKMLLSKNCFVKGGIESTWLLNYDAISQTPEFNWIIGLGSQKYKLKWSVNYIRGFTEQSFYHLNIKPDGHYKGSLNWNNMLQLQLSYPLGQLKF